MVGNDDSDLYPQKALTNGPDGATYRSVKSRLIALALALLIGTPLCLCCVQAEALVKKTTSCCESKKTNESSHDGRQRSCPCSGSVTQRDLAQNSVESPPTALTAPMVTEMVEFVSQVLPVETGLSTLCDNIGPPYKRRPIYLRQQALLL